jgi:hypothetical protein
MCGYRFEDQVALTILGLTGRLDFPCLLQQADESSHVTDAERRFVLDALVLDPLAPTLIERLLRARGRSKRNRDEPGRDDGR